jgi:hypothetical protein
MSDYDQRQQSVNAQYNADVINIFPSNYVEQQNTPRFTIPRPRKLDCPSLPASFLRRQNYFDLIETRLKDAQLGFCIIEGESGSGKTSSAVDAYIHLVSSGDYDGYWFDCRQVIYSKASFNVECTSRSLIVMDFLNSAEHPMITGGFIEQNCRIAKLLIITNSEDVTRKLLQVRGLANRRGDVCVHIDKFSLSEMKSLVEQSSGLPLSENDLQSIMIRTQGYPQFCQMICNTLVSANCEVCSLLTDDVANLGNAKALAAIFGNWLSSCLRSRIGENVINCLIHIPFIGLQASVISTIIKEDEMIVLDEIEKLERIGILSSIRSIYADGKLFYMHDVIRALRDELPVDDDLVLSWRENYLNKLSELLRKDKLTVGDIIPCIDAWISGWASAFLSQDRVEADPKKFLDRLASYENMLPSILPVITHCFKQADQISFVLKPYVNSEMHCSPLTGLGNMLRNVDPNYLVAEIMWNAVYNHDAWGRASALGVCVSHWQRLGQSARKLATERLYEWFETVQKNIEKKMPGWLEADGTPSPGLDLIVALSGVARIVGETQAVNLFRSPRYRANFSDRYATNCMMLLRAWKAGGLSKSRFQSDKNYVILEDCLNVFNECALRVFNFLKDQEIDPRLRALMTDITRQYADQGGVSLSLDIALYADCMEFFEYARKHEPEARIHF